MFNVKKTVLIVDDIPANLTVLANLLKSEYTVKAANNGQKAIEIVQKEAPDLILLDVMMPEMDGWEVCSILKNDSSTSHIPVIFLTAKNGTEDEEKGLKLGAVDFISKPFSPPIVLARIKTHLQNKEYQDFLLNQSDWLRDEVAHKVAHINQLHDASMMVMISLVEFRDENTGWHIRRTQKFVEVLARHLAVFPDFSNILSEEYIQNLNKSAPLHDIGKIAIPDAILLKAGKLDDDEITIMKTHAIKGEEMLKRAQRYMEIDPGFLTIAVEIAGGHHEKWDGTGYPRGISGEAIPLSARLMAVADVYDALTTVRPYKKAFSHEEASDIIFKSSKTHFDPIIVEAFRQRQEEFKTIAFEYKDGKPLEGNK
ncbi:MAG: two-component system response regulator [Sulfurimonas sp.]|jgi:putative two-component system response regulator